MIHLYKDWLCNRPCSAENWRIYIYQSIKGPVSYIFPVMFSPGARLWVYELWRLWFLWVVLGAGERVTLQILGLSDLSRSEKQRTQSSTAESNLDFRTKDQNLRVRRLAPLLAWSLRVCAQAYNRFYMAIFKPLCIPLYATIWIYQLCKLTLSWLVAVCCLIQKKTVETALSSQGRL